MTPPYQEGNHTARRFCLIPHRGANNYNFPIFILWGDKKLLTVCPIFQGWIVMMFLTIKL
jgi:hypothetical protein